MEDQIFSFFIEVSEKVRSEVQHIADIPYGTSDTEKLDLFVPDHLPKGMCVCVCL